MPIVVEELVPIALQQARPVVSRGYRASLTVGRLCPLVRHLEEQQIRQLLDVVSVAHPVVPEDVAVVPEFLDDLTRFVHGGGYHFIAAFLKRDGYQDLWGTLLIDVSLEN